jgi:hypothetical protein
MATSYFNLMMEYIRQAEDAIDDEVLERIYTLYYNLPTFGVPSDECSILRKRIYGLGRSDLWCDVLPGHMQGQSSVKPSIQRWGEESYFEDPMRNYVLEHWSFPAYLWDIWFGPNPLAFMGHMFKDRFLSKPGKVIRFQAHVLELVLGESEDLPEQKALLRVVHPKHVPNDLFIADIEGLYDQVAAAQGVQGFDYTNLRARYKELCAVALETSPSH